MNQHENGLYTKNAPIIIDNKIEGLELVEGMIVNKELLDIYLQEYKEICRRQ